MRKAASQLSVAWVGFGGTTGSKRSHRPRLGTAIPSWCGTSIQCVGAWRRRLSRIPPTSLCLHAERRQPSRAGGPRKVVHMHGELFKSRCDRCNRPPFEDTNLYEPPAQIPRCKCGGRIRPHICCFGKVPFELDRIYRTLDQSTIFIAVGTSGVVEPAATKDNFYCTLHPLLFVASVAPESPFFVFLGITGITD